ncbi:jg1640 [Pararge aegeria aegeria]|uniref:Jg1640 protein n=1 Tax=Pararge aegeria aegeria TaxID=348720 RepID=A0A8S4RCS5_9NEOP|nr:jg1640 [Pararge aegeria aegeria]
MKDQEIASIVFKQSNTSKGMQGARLATCRVRVRIVSVSVSVSCPCPVVINFRRQQRPSDRNTALQQCCLAAEISRATVLPDELCHKKLYSY